MKTTALAVCLSICICVPALSSTTVQFVDVYGQTASIAGSWYTGQVSAGIYRLRVDGVLQDSFCIDLADTTTTNVVQYSTTSLANAPDPTLGPMNAEKADTISKLWSMAYSPNMTQSQAAALQLAIWDSVVDNDHNLSTGNFRVTGNDYGAQTLLNNLATYTGDGTNLIALTHSQYQDFAIAAVPAPGALALGSLGLTLIGWFRSRRRL
jgi:hypothetical protein